MSDQPTPQQVRRALARAERGAALDVAEADGAAGRPGRRTSTGCAPPRPGSATRGWSRPDGPGVVTYSPKVFIPVTRLCRDRCHYCTFVESPGQLRARPGRRCTSPPTRSSTIAREGAELGCLEALFTLGDRPEDRWPEARAWLDEQGYDSTLAYVRAMAIRVLEETGLLPHLNPGVHVVGGDEPAQAGRPLDGDDARDHLAAALRGQGARRTSARRTRTPTSGCGCSRTPAGSRSRSPPGCWSGSARR